MWRLLSLMYCGAARRRVPPNSTKLQPSCRVVEPAGAWTVSLATVWQVPCRSRDPSARCACCRRRRCRPGRAGSQVMPHGCARFVPSQLGLIGWWYRGVEAARGAQVQLHLVMVAGVDHVDGRSAGWDRPRCRAALHLVRSRCRRYPGFPAACRRAHWQCCRHRQQLGLVEHLQAATAHVGRVDACRPATSDALHAAREHGRALALGAVTVHEPAVPVECHHVVVVVADPDVGPSSAHTSARAGSRIPATVGALGAPAPHWRLQAGQLAGRAAGLVGVELLHALLERVDHVEAVGAPSLESLRTTAIPFCWLNPPCGGGSGPADQGVRRVAPAQVVCAVAFATDCSWARRSSRRARTCATR